MRSRLATFVAALAAALLLSLTGCEDKSATRTPPPTRTPPGANVDGPSSESAPGDPGEATETNADEEDAG